MGERKEVIATITNHSEDMINYYIALEEVGTIAAVFCGKFSKTCGKFSKTLIMDIQICSL